MFYSCFKINLLVYTGLKSAFTGYTEEDAKKSVKDVVIILSKNAINKKTGFNIKCPVDVTVYDGDGNICAQIVDDVVNEDYQDVAAYTKGDDKYLILTDTDYIICYSGNDTGTMDYIVTEYENDEVVRELVYNDVPLTTEKKYVNYLASGRHQGISLYNLNEIKGDVIEAVSDIDKVKEQAAPAKSITLSDKTLSLKKGESYILMETISPDDAVSRDVTWSSSNDEVVEVNGSGILYAKAEGEAVVTVKIDGRNISDSCRIEVVQENTSPVPPTEIPSASPSGVPTAAPSPLPSNLPVPTAAPTSNPFGGSSGGYIPGPAATDPVIVPSPVPTLLPSQIPSPSPTAVPVMTITPAPVQTPLTTPETTITPEITPAPSVMPEPSQTPEATLTPSASPVAGESNSTSSPVRLKKGLKVKDKKTKAVYKITSTGKNKTAEYVKSTKKNTADIVIPASVKLKGKTFKVLSIGKGAFKNNKKLKSVKIGKNITSIGAKAFSNCTSLTIITIPSKVKKIGKKAFYKCKNLQYILVKTKKLKANNIGIDAFSKIYSNPRIKSDKSVCKRYQDIFISKGLPDKALFIVNPVKLVV